MGSWTELDATYPPGTLTPAAVLVVALGHLAGATSVYAEGGLAAFLPRGLAYDPDLLRRAERSLAEAPLDVFLAEARERLSARQKLVLALQLVDRQLAAGDDPARRALVAQILAGVGLDAADLAAHRATLALKNDLAIFPQ
jgi:hypothetical protein